MVVLVAIVVGSFRINVGGWGTKERTRHVECFRGDELIFLLSHHGMELILPATRWLAGGIEAEST